MNFIETTPLKLVESILLIIKFYFLPFSEKNYVIKLYLVFFK